MKKNYIFLVVFLLALFNVKANEVFIKDINSNPGRYNHEVVTFEGIVTRFEVQTPATSSYYMIRDDYGAEIRVNTSTGSPQVGKRYKVTGTVTIHMQEPLVIESAKSLMEEVFVQETPVPPKDNTLMYIIIAALVVIAGLIIFFIMRPKADSIQTKKPPYEKAAFSQGGEAFDINKGQTYDTIKFETSAPPTVKVIPGELEILNGPDKGKTLMIVGYFSSDGIKASIGRYYETWKNDFPGDHRFAHISVKDESNTLSRKQAEIIFSNKKVFLKNLSNVNPTQVDGVVAEVNEKVELKTGSIIKAGYIEFKYIK